MPQKGPLVSSAHSRARWQRGSDRVVARAEDKIAEAAQHKRGAARPVLYLHNPMPYPDSWVVVVVALMCVSYLVDILVKPRRNLVELHEEGGRLSL